MITIEFEEPKQSVCECCGGTTTRLTRFVHRDDDAYSVYYASFTDTHPEKLVYLLVSIGEWGEGTVPNQRTAFAIQLRSTNNEYQVSITNAKESPWSHVEFLGKILDREEALKHPLVKEAFHVTDHITMEDKPVQTYLG